MKNQFEYKLAHLSNEQIETLMARYYQGEKSTLLIKEYLIDIRSSQLIKTFPLKVHNDTVCQFCKIPMVSERVSYSSKWSKQKIFCEQCMHEDNKLSCTCNHCRNLRIIHQEQLENNKRNLIIDYWKTLQPIPLEKLSLKEKLYLSALLRVNLSEDLVNIKPIFYSPLEFAPTLQYQHAIIAYLFEKNIIFFSPDTSIESITIKNNCIISYTPSKAIFQLNISDKSNKNTINSLLNLTCCVENLIEKEKKELWREIGTYECLEYLYAIMQEMNLPIHQIGDKTILSIQEALSSFSISEVFYFISYSVKEAIVYSQKEKIYKQRAVNIIPNKILRIKEKAFVENWKNQYARHNKCPQTEISKIFFYKVFSLGDKGFKEVIY